MSNVPTKLENILFDYGTTYKTSYRGGDLPPEVSTVYKGKERFRMVKPPPLADVHTLSRWKGAPVPFSLLHKRKPVVNDDPRTIQKPYEKPVDTDRDTVQMTRPRVFMTPAVGMDDIADPTAREILIGDMYTSEMSRSTRIPGLVQQRVEAPLPGKPAPANPIVLPKLQPPVVPPEWRKDSVTWDSKQLRSYCDPTKEFWLAHKLPDCGSCREASLVTAQRNELRRLRGVRR